MSKFKPIYDAIEEVSNEVTKYALDEFGTEKRSEETKDKIKKLREAISIVRDAAHELNEHLAWDDDD